MQQYISYPRSAALDNNFLSESAQHERRRIPSSTRDEKEQRRDPPLPFQGDGDPSSGVALPPLAWTLMWKETNSNAHGYYLQD